MHPEPMFSCTFIVCTRADAKCTTCTQNVDVLVDPVCTACEAGFWWDGSNEVCAGKLLGEYIMRVLSKDGKYHDVN